MQKIYAIYDIIAEAIVGQLLMARHDAAAIRIFGDIAAAKEPNVINQHVGDFRLITLGAILEHGQEPGYELHLVELIPAYRIVLEGKQWLALQERDTTEGNALGDVTSSLANSRE